MAVGGLGDVVGIELGQLGIGGVEGKDARLVDGDGDFEGLVEVGSQPVAMVMLISQVQLNFRSRSLSVSDMASWELLGHRP